MLARHRGGPADASTTAAATAARNDSALVARPGRPEYRRQPHPSRAGRTLWLNPEPELYWDYGDSESTRYAKWCEMHRCATAADLTGLAKLLTTR